MNSRKWISLFIIATVILFVAFQVLWRAFSVEEKLKELITKELQPVVQGEISIERISVNLHSIDLEDVSFHFPQKPYQIKIKRLQLGFSIFNFLKYNLNPVRFVSEIILEKPVIKIKNIPNSERTRSENSSAPDIETNIEEIEEQYKRKLIDLGFVGQLIVNNGSIIWITVNEKEIDLLKNLRGWVSTTELENSYIRMEGRLFQSENNNIQLEGRANLISGRIDSVCVRFSDDNLSTTLPSIQPEILKVKNGQLTGTGIIRESEKGKLILDGDIAVSDAELELYNGSLNLKNLNTEALIRDWDMEIQSCQLYYDESPVTVSGQISDFLNPVFDLSIEASKLDIKKIFTSLYDKNNPYELDGKAQAFLHIKGQPKSPAVDGIFRIPKMSLKGQTIRNVNLNIQYDDKVLVGRNVSGDVHHLNLKSFGTVSFRGDQPFLDVQFKSQGDLKPVISKGLNPEIDQMPINIQGMLRGSGKNMNGRADFSLYSNTTGQDSIPISGEMTLENQKIQLKVVNGENPFEINTTVDFKDERLKIESTIDHFGGELWDLTTLPIKDRLREMVYVNISYTGDQRYGTFSIASNRRDDTEASNNLFRIEANYNSKNDRHKFLGDILYYPDTGEQIRGNLRLQISPDAIAIEKLSLGDFYNASARIGLNKEHNITGKITIDNADLAYVFDGVFIRPNYGMYGKISGSAEISGTLKNPEIHGEMSLQEGIFRATGYYSGKTTFQMVKNRLELQQSNVYLDEKKIVDVTGYVDLAQKKLDLQCQGQQVQLSVILKLIRPDIDFFDGKADINLQVSEGFSNPEITGNIRAQHGTLFFVNYDSLYMTLGEPDIGYFEKGKTDNQDRLTRLAEERKNEAGLFIRDAHLARKGNYTIKFNGFLPFSQDNDLDMQLTGKGDAIAVLFEDVAFIQDSESESSFRWGFGGTYGNLVYTEGSVSVKNGMMQLEDVAPVIENFELDATLEPLNQFLHINHLTGTINNRKFFAETSLDSSLKMDHLEPLVISDWGLNFGVIKFNTSDKGISIHIPGLMGKNEFGDFIFKGRDYEKQFIIAGPAENPLARGKILAKDASFTYPFVVDEEESDGEESDLIEEILLSMIWDVHFTPIKNVHYVKQIPGLIDKVWIDAFIDPEVSALDITGSLSDETLRFKGLVQSTRGNIEYLDLNFKVENFGAEFDRSVIFPIVYGKARTTISDSMGRPSNVYLTLYVYDKESGQEMKRGRWSKDIRFKLSSDNPAVGTNELQILSSLGYPINNLDYNNIAEMIGTSTDQLLFRPLFRPLERKLEQTLGLDVIRFNSRFTRNVIDMIQPNSSQNLLGLESNLDYDIDPRYFLFRSTQVMVGKYFSNDVYFHYSGELEAGQNWRYQQKGLGLKHSLNLEYRISPHLLLELQYKYNSLLLDKNEDKRIQIRHSFNF